MKKIFYKIILLCSFFFISNVSAKTIFYNFDDKNLCDENGNNCLTTDGLTDYTFASNVNDGSNALSLINNSITSSIDYVPIIANFDTLFGEYSQDFTVSFDSYIKKSSSNGNPRIYTVRFVNEELTSSFNPYFSVGYNYSTCWFNSTQQSNCYNYNTWLNYTISFNHLTQLFTVTVKNMDGSIYSEFTTSSSKTIDNNYIKRFVLGCEYYSSTNKSIGFSGYIDNLYISNTTSIDTSPTIEITKENENITNYNEKDYITSVTLKIDFGTIDNDKYLYMYKYGLDSEWSTMMLTESNNFSKTYSENNTLYVQIKDKTTHEVVVQNTFTISSIEKLPDDYFEDELKEDTINSSFNSKDVIFHKCKLNLEAGYGLCELEINNFNNDLYNYYHKIGNSTYTRFFPDEKTQVLPEVYDDSLFIKALDNISLYQKWQIATDKEKTYILSLKIYENTRITILKENKETGEKQYYTFTVTMLTENNDMNLIEQFIYNHLLSKFYFVYQFKQIIEYVNSYDFEENAKAPSFTFDLSFIGLEPVTVDMTVDEHTRMLIHGYIELFASILVVISFIKSTSKTFK